MALNMRGYHELFNKGKSQNDQRCLNFSLDISNLAEEETEKRILMLKLN